MTPPVVVSIIHHIVAGGLARSTGEIKYRFGFCFLIECRQYHHIEIDRSTGTIRGRAQFVNSDRLFTPERLQVILEMDKRGGLFTEGHDTFGKFDVDYATADQVDWAGQLDNWLRQSAQRRLARLSRFRGEE